LKENGRKERGYTLFQLSIEELGKASIVYFFATLPDSDKANSLKIFKKEFVSHKTKTAKAINFDAIMLSSINNRTERHKFLYAILMGHENIVTLNDFKNYSLYTSIINEKFLLPSENISEDLLEEIEARATLRYELIKPTLEFLLKGFDEVKNANIKFDNDQI
jgi:AbiV family abortive infection protein